MCLLGSHRMTLESRKCASRSRQILGLNGYKASSNFSHSAEGRREQRECDKCDRRQDNPPSLFQGEPAGWIWALVISQTICNSGIVKGLCIGLAAFRRIRFSSGQEEIPHFVVLRLSWKYCPQHTVVRIFSCVFRAVPELH